MSKLGPLGCSLAKIPGATYNEYMTSNASVLVCNDPRSVNQEKLRHASQWSVPAVSSDWIWDSIQSGRKKSFEPYMIKRQSSQGDKAVERREDALNNDTSQVIQPRQGSTEKEVIEVKENTPDVQEKPVIEKPPKTTKENNSRPANQQIPQKRTSMSQPRSPSPRKEQTQTNAGTSSVKRQDSDQSTASAAAFDLAVNGLLARATSSKPNTDSNEQNDSSNSGNNIRQRKRKPLLGRAPSLSSTRNFSRASSVDTLNEDGCGSGIESLATDKTTGTSRTNSRNGPPQQQQSFSSLFSGSKFDFDPEAIHRGNLGDAAEQNRDGEGDEEPPLTQLNYEDPDAVAMRQQFLRKAGKLVDKDPRENQAMVVGEMKELEDTGWGTGRRTRKAAAGKTTDGLEKF